ncbi:MAG: hypothetical protein HC840_28085 [Leptolyngbyaceae cyanobacterium RM2_2_4]|nr:hypothetical protein [Leptolyngbyaceae cyanobacterium RM2_2_4]
MPISNPLVTVQFNSYQGLQPFQRKVANYSAVTGDRILADVTGGNWTLTLPQQPTYGQDVEILTRGTGTLTVSPGSAKLNGVNQPQAIAS